MTVLKGYVAPPRHTGPQWGEYRIAALPEGDGITSTVSLWKPERVHWHRAKLFQLGLSIVDSRSCSSNPTAEEGPYESGGERSRHPFILSEDLGPYQSNTPGTSPPPLPAPHSPTHGVSIGESFCDPMEPSDDSTPQSLNAHKGWCYKCFTTQPYGPHPHFQISFWSITLFHILRTLQPFKGHRACDNRNRYIIPTNNDNVDHVTYPSSSINYRKWIICFWQFSFQASGISF